MTIILIISFNNKRNPWIMSCFFHEKYFIIIANLINPIESSILKWQVLCYLYSLPQLKKKMWVHERACRKGGSFWMTSIFKH